MDRLLDLAVLRRGARPRRQQEVIRPGDDLKLDLSAAQVCRQRGVVERRRQHGVQVTTNDQQRHRRRHSDRGRVPVELSRLGVTAGTLVALLGVAWRFEEPLYPGTRVHVDLSVGSVRPTRRPDRGVVVLDAALSDDAGTIYQRGEFTMLVRTRPAGIA